jgi:hypothetical protein
LIFPTTHDFKNHDFFEKIKKNAKKQIYETLKNEDFLKKMKNITKKDVTKKW